MNVKDMQGSARTVSELMKVLSNENRLMILCQLAEGEKSVGELAELLGMRHAALSQQLTLLRKDALVQPRREAQTIYYSIARDDVYALLQFLHQTYCATDSTLDESIERHASSTAS